MTACRAPGLNRRNMPFFRRGLLRPGSHPCMVPSLTRGWSSAAARPRRAGARAALPASWPGLSRGASHAARAAAGRRPASTAATTSRTAPGGSRSACQPPSARYVVTAATATGAFPCRNGRCRSRAASNAAAASAAASAVTPGAGPLPGGSVAAAPGRCRAGAPPAASARAASAAGTSSSASAPAVSWPSVRMAITMRPGRSSGVMTGRPAASAGCAGAAPGCLPAAG